MRMWSCGRCRCAIRLRASVRTSLWLWLAAVGVLLLIACANVAHLQLVRIFTQAQALAVRSALGATRGRIVARCCSRPPWYRSLAALPDCCLSIPATKLLMHLLASQLPRAMSASPDPRLLGFCLLLAILVTVLSATLPCWWAARRDPAAALNRGTRSGSTDRSTAVWRRGLLALEIGLSFLLVTTSGLLLRTIQHIRESAPWLRCGEPAGASTRMRRRMAAIRRQKRIVELAQLDRSIARIARRTSRRADLGLPTGHYGSNGSYAIPDHGQNMDQAGLPWAIFSLAGSGYFNDMHIPLLRGQGCHPCRYIWIAARRGHQRVAWHASPSATADPLGQTDRLRHGRGQHARSHHRRSGGRCAPGLAGRRSYACTLFAAGAASSAFNRMRPRSFCTPQRRLRL